MNNKNSALLEDNNSRWLCSIRIPFFSLSLTHTTIFNLGTPWKPSLCWGRSEVDPSGYLAGEITHIVPHHPFLRDMTETLGSEVLSSLLDVTPNSKRHASGCSISFSRFYCPGDCVSSATTLVIELLSSFHIPSFTTINLSIHGHRQLVDRLLSIY